MYIYKNKYHNCEKKIETLVERRAEERREKGRESVTKATLQSSSYLTSENYLTFKHHFSHMIAVRWHESIHKTFVVHRALLPCNWNKKQLNTDTFFLIDS